MDSFEEWAKAAEYQCFQDWGDTVVELGASWDSFKRKSKDEIVGDLVSGGVPILAARDITEIASAKVRKSQEPMAVFWDLENMPIPAEASGRDITSTLKAILSHQGDLVQFRGYASIGLNHIPVEKRSDLQLSGCHLVDCPHHGRKEVADKMIIVDAMQFAFQHPNGATLCFITGDVDYAYLLATLQRPQWRTIVISRGTMQSMLHINCDMMMRWETDILNPIYEMRGERLQGSSEEKDPKGYFSKDPFTPLTAEEEWSDDVELLRSVIKQLSRKQGSLAPRKSDVGSVLRSTNPARFSQRTAIQSFLAKAIDKGIVMANGDGAWKTLCLPAHADYISSVPTLSLLHACPVPQQEMPTKMLEKVKACPFVIILKKKYCPSGSSPPFKAIVQSTTEWLFYMFKTQCHANNAAQECNWLHYGEMVDMRRQLSFPDNHDTPQQKSQKGQMVNCPVCMKMVPQDNTIQYGRFSFVCSDECKEWDQKDPKDKDAGVKLVVETLEFLATYDDIYVQMSMLVKFIHLRHPQECSSRTLSKLWVLEGERTHAIKLYKHMLQKQKYVALPKYFDVTYSQIENEPTVDTSEQEAYIYNILFDEKCGWIDRRSINVLLCEKFGMSSPHARNQVFLNGRSKSFFVAKDGHKQVVALNLEAANAALELGEDKVESEAKMIKDASVTAPSESSCFEDNSSDEEDIEALICSRRY
mmetsp:Transcript_10863/g.16620  ORF Transcript_10863/g.16620 Transcript_10863/m.16620 type:complete len:700 (+) Transcript_10863:119-2218(+)